MKIVRFAFAALALLSIQAPAEAQTYTTHSGHINRVFASLPMNFGFRVFFSEGMGDCADGFAFVETDFGNYQAYVSTLLSAHAQRKRVELVTDKVDHLGKQYCRIVEFSINDD
ncbi:hypothetical protein [Novosphingobium sp.]|uniref:hypothetical protein n=1 Tax=Novosphingobium sp. TaxID=1874826 RepID=UPI002FE41A24